MRGTSAFVWLAVGCGHIGFDVCAGCSTPAGQIERVQVFAPGSELTPLDIPVTPHPGNLLLAAVYANGGNAGLGDDANGDWQTAPEEVSPCSILTSTYGSLRFYYRFADSQGPHTLTVYAGNGSTRVGAIVIEYAGADATPLDTSSGDIGLAVSTSIDAGTIDANGKGQLVAAFEDSGHALVLAPVDPLHVLAHDDPFSIMVADMPVDVGTYTPSASAPAGDAATKCWLGASLVLRAR